MISSEATMSRSEIREALKSLVGADLVITDEDALRKASVDRFKKYSAAHGIFDGPIPAAIVLATSTAVVAAVLRFADEYLINIVPRTGGTATEGGLETIIENSVVLDGSPMDQILDVDEVNMQVRVQCGVPLQRVEDFLRERGLTTGHSPQSKPIAQYGGLVATRSIGQFSTLYGGIEDMTVGLEAVFPGGVVTRIKNVPRRAAGPDIRHIVIGNEGALCFITEVTLKIFRFYPENNRYFGFLLDDFGSALDALRQLVTAGYRPSVCRAYSVQDARQHFSHFANDKNVVALVAEGPKPLADATASAIEDLFATIPCSPVDSALIEQWFDGLNWGQNKVDEEREAMLQTSHLGYTTEVSVDWSRSVELFDAVIARIAREFPHAQDLTMLGGHSSHSYQTGTNLYFVYDYDIQCDARQEIREYHIPLNAIIVDEAIKVGGSMVHHHGIGKYRTPWVREEHGSAYFLLEGLKSVFDPHGIMNAGTIFPVEEFSEPWPTRS
jgi:alkyldihydroxyacetonephosphate synthase